MPEKPSISGGPSALLRLRVTATAESVVRGGHPWVFADSVREQTRDGVTGELAAIYDRKDRFLAVGLFDPDSPIRLRVLHAGKPAKIDDAWWEARFDQAIQRRNGLADEHTTGLRLIHGESDGWPGLVLDRYADVFVLKLYTAVWLPRLGELLKLIERKLQPGSVVLRLSRNMQSVAARDFARRDGEIAVGKPASEKVIFLENGIRFEADVVRGQKTGFFLDQRENRRRVGELAAGRDVLNAFSFSGGFSLYAARGGATSVTNLDISEHALTGARANFALNQKNAQIAQCKQDAIQADAFEWMSKNVVKKFDLIVLDPPSLAKREAERAGAIRAYQALAADAISHLRKNGVLVACSCSAHVSAEEFSNAVRTAARLSERDWDELQTTGHPADHPASFAEANYLKGIYLRIRQ